MEWLLIIGGFVFLIVGLLGAVLPLPGPPLSFAGLLLLHYTQKVSIPEPTLWTMGALTVLVSVADYMVPMWGAKKFGGSKYGSWGSGIGLLVGLFLGPLGMFIGAFAGAFIGEYYFKKNQEVAFKAAIGSFLGLVAGIVAKTILCLYLLYLGIAAFF